MKKLCMTIMLVALATGCQAPPTNQSEDMCDTALNSPMVHEVQWSRAVGEMMQRMLTDPEFTSLCEKARASKVTCGQRRPVIVVGKIEVIAQPGNNDNRAAAQIRQELKVALRKTGLFEIVDPEGHVWTSKTDCINLDGEGADGIFPSIGECPAGDFTLEGEGTTVRNGDSFEHFLRLQIFDKARGMTLWGDFVRISRTCVGGEK